MAVKKKIKLLEEFKSITPILLEKIKNEGIDNVEVLATFEAFSLASALDISEVRALKVIQEAKDNLICYVETAGQVIERRTKIKRLKTGCNSIDNLLNGGIETQCIIEFYGEFGSGKTQIMHQLTIMAQLGIERGGLDGAVVYIDTENTFRPERFKPLCERLNVDYEDIIKNIYYVAARNSNDQILILDKLNENIQEIYSINPEATKKDIKLVIFDSIISLLRSEYLGRGTLSERQQRLNKILSGCLKFALNNNAIVALTNQVSANPDFIFTGQMAKPVGGNILGHAATYRLYIRKGRERKRIIKIIDAPDLPNAEGTFEITEAGVVDTASD